MEFIKNLALKIDVSPEEVADLFSRMDDKEQAQFFNQVGDTFKLWGAGAACTQIHGFSTSEALNDVGRDFLRLVSDYNRTS